MLLFLTRNITFTFTFTFTFSFTWRNRSCPAAGPAESRVGLEDAWYGCAPLYFVSSFRLEAASRPLPSTL